ncbi:phosphate ABC transporter substrate-binding protein PstS [Zhihengliuella alba]|uniref:Phosphate-binding protein n=1 Tax=Zhihengliuella alba TaxID=547018 RepID=A0ABP7E0E0_9MICC
MKKLHFAQSAAVLSVAAVALTACGGSNNPTTEASGSAGGGAASEVTGTLSGGGASSQEAAMTAWTDGFSSVAPEATVQYNPVGSGSGREGFLAGQYSFAGSDAAMDAEELESSKEVCGPDGAFHIPAYISPVAVAFNLEGVDTLNLDAETIAGIFAGKITAWNAPEIAEQNPDAELPETPITVVHRSDSSGTTENFTDYLTAAAPENWTYDVVEDWPQEIVADNAQGTAGVVGLVSSTDGAITYADASAVGSLGTVAVKVGEEYVPYSAEAAAKAVENANPVEGAAENDMAVELDRNTTAAGTYPIVLVSYHIYCNAYQDQETADLVKAFAEYVVSEDGQTTAEGSAGNAPLSESLRERALESIGGIGVQG